jgi:hypothetical protein
MYIPQHALFQVLMQQSICPAKFAPQNTNAIAMGDCGDGTTFEVKTCQVASNKVKC